MAKFVATRGGRGAAAGKQVRIEEGVGRRGERVEEGVKAAATIGEEHGVSRRNAVQGQGQYCKFPVLFQELSPGSCGLK